MLDTCEHLLDACAELCDAILARPGHSRLLATCREPVGVIGEQLLAALRKDWEQASMLLAAGERSVYRSPATVQLNFAFRDRVRAVLGPDRSRRLRADGRALPLVDAREAALR